ncbi:unnamed protein product [Phytophthora lilii]|uniref:Unnamed protein product n=1 Tax=Phytophthora lilii TaxID=2077276 RepID=A0A9W6XF78_9STRA|nr:unnamed protein product [Phytophthora lilii]
MPKPRTSTRRPTFARQLPSDSLLEASELALTAADLDELRSSALKLAPTPTAPSELHQMWIPCPTVAKNRHLSEILEELATDVQPVAWKEARQARSLQDFKLIPNAGIRFTCTSRNSAASLSLVKLKAFGHDIQIARFSKYGARYYVDLVRLPDEVTDRMIFDWFASRGVSPTCICPTFARNGLSSRERTVYFGQDYAPQLLVPSEDAPLREIEFTSPDDGMVHYRPCFVNHKVARYNRVTPPSILARQREDVARRAKETNTSDRDSTAETPVSPAPTGFASSLKASIQEREEQSSDNDSPPSTPVSPHSDADMGETPPAIDDDASDADSADTSLSEFMDQNVEMPKLAPTAAVWAKAASNRLALLNKAGSSTTEVKEISNTFDQEGGFAEPTTLIKPNYYEPLWFDDPDETNPKWHYDLEIRRDESDEVTIESSPVHKSAPEYADLITPAVMSYDVETMTRAELFVAVEAFVSKLDTSSAVFQLAAVEANPGLMLSAIETKAGLDKLAFSRAATFKHILKKAKPKQPDAKHHLLTLAAWDVVVHIMAPTVYQDPLKLFVLTGESPRFLTNLTIPLLTDQVLWKLSFSSFAMELLDYETAPDFLKSLIEDVQAMKPSSTGDLTPRLHF